jgi:uncharacterized protein (DUF2252 family)
VSTDVGGASGRPFASAWRRAHLSVAERVERGRAARRDAPRSSHARWEPAADRPDPVGLLEAQAAQRVPELVPIRYGRMLASPFAFFRGAAAIMAADLAGSPRSGVTVQLCGDAHLANFGLFWTPERQLFFDVNDFDETLPGPWEWDVKRLAASFEVAGRDRGFRRGDRRAIVTSAVGAYRKHMRSAARLGTLAAWYEQLEVQRLLDDFRAETRVRRLGRNDARHVSREVEKARSRDNVRVFTKRVRSVDGELRIRAEVPLIVPIEELIEPGSEWEAAAERIKRLLAAYRRTLAHEHHPLEEFRDVHAARKVVGVGSVGTRCYILLLEGRDRRDPLFLQVKEAQQSVLEPFLGASHYKHHGERVVTGQRLMQAASEIFLGWQRIKGLDGRTRDYYVRQLHDWKGSFDVENFSVQGAHPRTRVRRDPRPSARALGRPDRDRVVPREERRVRPGRRRFRSRLRRPERT